MSPVIKSIDARGLPCPQPVILARKALAEGGFEILEITVDDPASRENLLKFAGYAKCAAATFPGEGTVTLIRLTPQGQGAPVPAPAPRPAAASVGAAVVLVSSDGIGQGDPDLARLLMRGFLYTLTEAEQPPRRVIFMNSGVKLAVAGSESLDNLRKLEARGVEVLACGTCLDFFKLMEQLQVGAITNMYEIAGHLLEGPALTIG